MKFAVSPEIFAKIEGVCFGVVAARAVDHRQPRREIRDLLQEAVEAARSRFQGVKVKEHPAIVPYREAMVRLGINPNKFSCSIEALAARIAKGGAFPFINNVVDLANAVSLRYLLAIGAHDMDEFDGDIEVRPARPGDRFLPFGAAEEEAPEPGEPVYASGHRVKTRRWIWRQSEEGKITGESSNIFFPIDGFKGINDDAVQAARDELALTLEKMFKCTVLTGFVDEQSPVMDLGGS